MWKFSSIWNVADLGKIWTRKKTNGLKRSFLAVKSAAPTLEGKTMYMLAKLMANVAISNVCIIVEFARSSGHYKKYRESRCHWNLLSEFKEITNIFSTTWFPEISPRILLQSKYSTRIMFMWNMWKLHLACKGIESQGILLQSKYSTRIMFMWNIYEMFMWNGLNTRLLCPLPTNPHELIERFSCNLQEIDCVMDRCPTCCVTGIELQIQPWDNWLRQWKWKWTGDLFYLEKSRQGSDKSSADGQ